MGKIADLVKGVALPEQKKRQALALDAEFSDLQAKAQKLETQLLHSQAEVNPLKRTIEEQEQKIAQLTASEKSALTFNQATGTHIDPSKGIHYCARCLSESKRSPLRNDPHGWSCMVCNKFFQDPARPFPGAESWQPLDPTVGY